MILTYENAMEIRNAYKFLVGKYLETESNIIDICIIPADLRQLARFLEYYKDKNAEESLKLAGFDPQSVRIVVIHEQTFKHHGYMIDLDDFLTTRGIPRNYDHFTKRSASFN